MNRKTSSLNIIAHRNLNRQSRDREVLNILTSTLQILDNTNPVMLHFNSFVRLTNIMLFNIIGAGRLGASLASALIQHANGQLGAICNQHLASAQHQVTQLSSGIAVASVAALPEAAITFITTTDDQLESVVHALLRDAALKPGDMIVHCSGVYSSELLYPLREKGCFVASIHPLKSFHSTVPDPGAFNGCDCVVEGDENLANFLSTLFGQLGAKVISLRAEKKPVYHAAATLASNYLVSLANLATQLFREAGIDAVHAKHLCEHLMESSLHNLKVSDNVSLALTGPLMRGDLQTILLHLKAIEDPEISRFYCAAGLVTLQLTQHEDDKLTALKSVLTTP
jgi:predicted short-subunit dehydrogenase-like oxidoreductase (DUF2520 family)